jgi:hypothetical protein
MTTRLDQRGWTAAQDLAPCVLCHQPAIMRSPRGKPCHWTCALAWADEHQDQDHEPERGKARCTRAEPCHQASCGGCYPDEHQDHEDGKCPACKGGGLVPAPGCTCNANAHTCAPMICTVCGGTGRA